MSNVIIGSTPTYGIVFSGGGALGAWEVGCYDAIKAHHGALPVIVTGASAGALNAVGVCAGMLPGQLEALWEGIAPEDVYRFRFTNWDAFTVLRGIRRHGVLGSILNFLSQHRSIHDNTPLEATLRRTLGKYFDDFIASQIYFALSVTNLNSGKGEYFYKLPPGLTLPSALLRRDVLWEQIKSVELLVNGLMGSTALPTLFSPTGSYFDGGVLLNQPITPAIFLRNPEPDILYVIIPSAKALGRIDDIIQIGQTVMTAWISASLVSQLNRVRLRNKMRKDRTKNEPDERLPVCVIRPKEDLGKRFGVTLLSFGHRVHDLVLDGKTTADAKLKEFDSNDPCETTWYDV